MRIALFCLALVGCASSAAVSLNPPAKHVESKEYVNVLKTWSRHGHIQSQFDDALDIDATLRSAEFRSAYAARYLYVYHITDQEIDKVRAQILTDGGEFYEFHLETATNDYLLNELAGYKSVWQLTLITDDGHVQHPVELRRETLRKEVNAAFYPYANAFSLPWRVRFATQTPDGQPFITAATTKITLRIAGPQGAVDMVWALRK